MRVASAATVGCPKCALEAMETSNLEVLAPALAWFVPLTSVRTHGCGMD
jgi:hypothetical protein